MRKYFKKQIAIPQDHGSWVFIFIPLVVGIFAGKSIGPATISLCIAAITAFLLRQPLTAAIKSYSGRRPRTDLPAARFWIIIYGVIALLALAELFVLHDGYIAYLAIPGLPVFAWHLWLVSRRAERRQAGVEIIATGVLSLVAPAAYWVGIGHYDTLGWWLWVLTWLQSAASIVYAYLRLEQREWKSMPNRYDRFRSGLRAFTYASFNFFLVAALSIGAGFLPYLISIPFMLQWLETLWGIDHPAIGWKPVKIGTRQLIVSLLWTISFVIFWKP